MATARDQFRFKKFSVDQTGCAMRINTDGVLLGGLAAIQNPERILDIGTGTGVIGLMLAQRYLNAAVFGIEIDESAARRAEDNFLKSSFSERMHCFHQDVLTWDIDLYFDLIVSNPPFFINALKNPDQRKSMARHGNMAFFDGLLRFTSDHLTASGKLQIVVPFEAKDWLKTLAHGYGLLITEQIDIRSFADSPVIRSILVFSRQDKATACKELIIYDKPQVYSAAYKRILTPYFLAF